MRPRGRDDFAAHERAVGVLHVLAARHPAVSATVYKNLGVAYHALSRTHPDADEAMVAAWRRYLEVAPATDRDLHNIRLLVPEAERTLRRAAPPPR